MTNYLEKHLNLRETPQTQAIPGTVKNSAGGFSFALDDWKQLDRFLILGAEGGTYYITEKDLTLKNAEAVQRCILADGARAVARIVEISDAGRAPKNDPALFALALAAAAESEATRALALNALPKVARTGTHLFHFLTYVQNFRGWGRSLRNAVAEWYTDRSDYSLANQLLKYQSRDGWSHADAIKLAHPKAHSITQNSMFEYAVKGEVNAAITAVQERPEFATDSPGFVWFAKGIELLHATDEKQVVSLIEQYKFPRELVPTQFQSSPRVWEALLPHIGYTGLVRNLANITRSGLLVPFSDASKLVVDRLGNVEDLAKSRIHPIQVLSSYLVYGRGYGERSGGANWTPVQPVVDTLQQAFYAAFGNVTSTGKNFLLGVDISGSMRSGFIAGTPGLTPHLGATVMAMVTARKEANYHILGFHHQALQDLGVTASDTLESAMAKTNRSNFGGTDCALPMLTALEKGWKIDTFAVYTDSETWAGKIHPVQALKKYRDTTGIPARLVVVGMTSNGFSIADPKDAGMLDIVGFDAAAPELIAQFALGNI